MVTTCSICGTTEAVDPGEYRKCLIRSIITLLNGLGNYV